MNYEIELDWDYAYLTVNGTPVATNLSTNTNPNGQNFGKGITGSSGGNWVTLTADLSAYAGQTVTIGFRYWTDGAVAEPGFMVDDISITGQALDGAESNAGWAFSGFKTTTGSESTFHFNSYVAEFRQYRTYDTGLQTGPYNFGFLNTAPDWVEHFPYQDGLLVSYWDSSFTDNNTSQHPGGGLILPIDAHPTRARATGRLEVALARSGLRLDLQPRSDRWPDPARQRCEFGDPQSAGRGDLQRSHRLLGSSTPLANVKTPNTGTKIRIKSVSAQGSFMQVQVLQ